MYPRPVNASDPARASAAQQEFPCQSCGANLHFAPGSTSLRCPYCGAEQQIGGPAKPVVEHSFEDALARLARRPASTLATGGHEIECKGCGAITLVTGHATSCPFCDSPLVVEIQQDNETLVPESLLPFKIDGRAAGEKFKAWVTSRWFAPSDLALRAQRAKLDGVYLPYYTYDALALVDYRGQRGTHYKTTETYTDSEGKTQTREVTKTHWTPCSGHVRVEFDDVMVCASKSLPHSLVDALEPWDLADLRGFDPAFLSGFMAERAAVDLREGFDLAKNKMVPEIKRTIERDIGGDDQRIDHFDADHRNVAFKLFMLPLWISSFRYNDKVYRFVVNARTGEVSGERPYSTAKIVLAVVITIAIIATIAFVLSSLK